MSGRPSCTRRSRIGKSLRTNSTSYGSVAVMLFTPFTSGTSSRGLGVALVALGLEPVGKLAAALLDDPAVDEHVHEVGLDVAQDPGVVRDEENAAIGLRGEPVHALGDDPQCVDVETGVGLVEDRELGVEQFELQDLVPLLLAAREA